MNEASIVTRAWRKTGRISTRVVRALNLDGAYPVRVPVLMYHKIGPVTHSEWWVSTEAFAAQVRALKAYGYEAITLDDLNAFRLGARRPPKKPVLMTFDDGYRDILTDVLPVLQRPETAFKITVFIPTARVGGDNRWDPGIDFSREPVARLLTWEEIHEVARTGCVDFQSHTLTHPRLNEIEAADADRELVESRQKLEHELGRPVRYFSYPFSAGTHTPHVRDAVRRAGYLAAVGAEEIVEPDSRDPWNIRRLIIYASTTLSFHPTAADRFLFGPKLLDDPDVPRTVCRDVSISLRVAGGRTTSTKAGAVFDCEWRASAVVERSVRGVKVALEIRPRAQAAEVVVVRPTGTMDEAVASIDAGPLEVRCTADLPASVVHGDLDARLILADERDCVRAHAGDWQPVVRAR